MSEHEKVSVAFKGYVGQADLFGREHPASLEGDPAAWALGKTLIDHGCFVLTTVTEIRGDHRVRDSVTAALLRRALITSEGIRVLAEAGLEEAVNSLFRTLLEIDVNLRLVVNDETDEMAHRLAAFHYLNARRHFGRMFGHPDTRGRLHQDADHFEWSREASRRMKEFFESDTFESVRDGVASSQYWHGFPSMQEAFEEAGCGDDYVALYSGFSPFIHAGNVDFDFSDIDDEGRPHLKALPQRDPRRTLHLIQGMCLKLVSVIRRFLEDHGQPTYQDPLRAQTDDGEEFALQPLDALTAEIAVVFRVQEEGTEDGKEGSGNVS